MKPRLVFIVTEDWYFCSHRLPLARAARDAGFEVSVITREGVDGARIRSEGFQLFSLDMRRGEIRPFGEFCTLLRLRRILRRQRPAIVHNVALKPVILGTIAARLAGVGSVVNALAGLGYAFTSTERRASVLRALSRFAFRNLFRSPYVLVIVQNEADRSMLLSFKIPDDRIALIAGSGVDLSAYGPLPEPEAPVAVAMVSRMLWDKGVGDLVDAARIVKRLGFNVRVRLVGPTDPANPSCISEATLNQWVAEGVVEWSGPVQNIAGVWEQAHISALPSYREGLPKSLLEAAACSRPLIATDVPGCRDVVVDGETGLLVPPKNPEALARAIIRLAQDPKLRARFGRAGRARVEAEYSLDRVIDQTLSLYQSMQAAV